MSLDRMRQLLGIVPIAEPSQALRGMEVGKLLVIQVVEQPGDVPEVGIAAECPRVSLHRGGHHQGVKSLVVVADVFLKEAARFCFRGEGHGIDGKIICLGRGPRPSILKLNGTREQRECSANTLERGAPVPTAPHRPRPAPPRSRRWRRRPGPCRHPAAR